MRFSQFYLHTKKNIWFLRYICTHMQIKSTLIRQLLRRSLIRVDFICKRQLRSSHGLNVLNFIPDEHAPSEPENGDPMVPDSSQRIIDGAAVHMLDKAFRDLKHEVKEFEASVTTSLDNRADATSALGSRVDDLNITLMRADNTANANGNDIAEQRIGLEEVSNKVEQVQRLCDEDIDAVKARLADVALELEENAHNIGENRNAAMQLQHTLLSSKEKGM